MAAENDKGTEMNETCMKHALNMPDIGGCPYCRIDELEEQNERDRCHGRDFIRLWKEGKERIAELERQLARYQGGVEVETVARSRGTSYAGMDCYVEVQLPMEYAGQRVRVLVKGVE